VASADGRRIVRKSSQGGVEEAVSLGSSLAESVLGAGGEEIVRLLRGY
jgi:hypothetical protein